SQQGRVQDAILRASILIRTPHRTYDLHQFEDRFFFNSFCVVANAELELFKDRMARARAALLRKGRIRTGRVPSLGYQKDPKTKQPIPNDRFPLLQRICKEVLTISVHELARRYGIHQNTLLWTLTNPLICGWPAQRYASYMEDRGYCFPGWRLPRDRWLWPEEPGSYPAA